jgi:hypothetical protein
MNQAIQFVNSRLALIKGKLGKFSPINGPVWIENLAPETLNDLVIDGFPGSHELVGDFVRVNGMCTEFGEGLTN